MKLMSGLNPKNRWWIHGLLWGLFMYVVLIVLFPLFDGSGITLSKLLIGIPVWLSAGLLYGYVTGLIENKRKAAKQNEMDANS